MLTNTQPDGSGDGYWFLSDANGNPLVAAAAFTELTLLASAARTTTTNTADQINLGAKGLILTLDVTAIAATPSVTLSVQYRDPASGKYVTLFTVAAAVTGTGTYTYILYPAAIVAAVGVTETELTTLPRTWRVALAHGDVDSITYSLGGCYLA